MKGTVHKKVSIQWSWPDTCMYFNLVWIAFSETNQRYTPYQVGCDFSIPVSITPIIYLLDVSNPGRLKFSWK